MTAAQWTAAQSAIAALSNPAVSAFFAHGANVIPGNSTTLVALGERDRADRGAGHGAGATGIGSIDPVILAYAI